MFAEKAESWNIRDSKKNKNKNAPPRCCSAINSSFADYHEARKKCSWVEQIKFFNIRIETNFSGQRIEPGLPCNFSNVLQWPVHPSRNYSAHNQCLPYRRIYLIDLSRFESSPACGSCENPYSAFEFFLCGETVSDDSTDAAFVRDTEAGYSVHAQRACHGRAVEP